MDRITLIQMKALIHKRGWRGKFLRIKEGSRGKES